MIKIEILGRDITPPLKEIMAIRESHFYSSAFNENYWKGGIHWLLDTESILLSHVRDPYSFFIIARDGSNNIAGYVRLSLHTKPNISEMENIASSCKIHIIAVSKLYIGREFLIEEFSPTRQQKLGFFLLNFSVNFARERLSGGVISEICIFPIPNFPSILLHKKCGFEVSKKEPEKLIRHNSYNDKEVVYFSTFFSRFGKNI